MGDITDGHRSFVRCYNEPAFAAENSWGAYTPQMMAELEVGKEVSESAEVTIRLLYTSSASN